MFDGTYSPPEVGSGSQPKHKKGQGLVEYALILALVSVAVIVILAMVGPAITQYFMDVRCTLQWKGSGRAFTAASAPGPNASGEWRTDNYKFIFGDYMDGTTAYCGLQNKPNARPAFPASGYTEPTD
jgi:Flp pilus assembly pilin Flp